MSKFKVVKGTRVKYLNKIIESFSVIENENYTTIRINVSAQNIDKIFVSLSSEVTTPGFIILEHGTNGKIEKELRKSDKDPFHLDVHYLDCPDFLRFKSIYEKYKKLLIQDGEIGFGFGSQSGIDEVFVGPYKIFTIFTSEPKKYVNKLIKLGFPQVEELVSVTSTFTNKWPGMRFTIEIDGIDIYKMIESLKDEGLYFVKRREDL